MEIEFSGAIWYWRGPSPYYFVTVPADRGAELAAAAKSISYGWGMIPVVARIGQTEWRTSLFPKDGSYLVPIKDAIRKPQRLDVEDTVEIRLSIAV
jgi:hypothetical protein